MEAEAIASIEKELEQKREIKERVVDSRRIGTDASAGEPSGPIPIRILDEGPNILHPATPEDILAIRQRLPAGVMDGLSEIVFGLGRAAQTEGEDADIWDLDPITNRAGHEILPGYHLGWLWGLYESPAGRITLHAVVVDPAARNPMPTRLFSSFRFYPPSFMKWPTTSITLARIARGRWLASDKEKVEHFAKQRQHEWTQSCVVPYLEEAYPQDVADLLAWLEAHGKIRFSLGELIADSRAYIIFPVEQAVESLIKDVTQGVGEVERLFNFARDLKTADLYERAQEVIDHILVQAPGHEDALELRARTWVFQKRYAEAVSLAFHVIRLNPRNWLARGTLAWAYEGLEDWEKVIETTMESLALFEDDLDKRAALARRCMAYWRLGRRDESDADLRILQGAKRGAGYRIKWILRERAKNSMQKPVTA